MVDIRKKKSKPLLRVCMANKYKQNLKNTNVLTPAWSRRVEALPGRAGGNQLTF